MDAPCIVVAAELRYGAARRRSARLTRQLETVLAALETLPLTEPADAHYAAIRSELAADEVVIYREDGRLVVEPVPRRPTLATILSRLTPLDEDFPPIADPPVRPEDTI